MKKQQQIYQVQYGDFLYYACHIGKVQILGTTKDKLLEAVIAYKQSAIKA